MNQGVSKIAKQIILEELKENTHPILVEDVIFWALEEYAKRKERTWGAIVAGAIIERISEAEENYQGLNN